LALLNLTFIRFVNFLITPCSFFSINALRAYIILIDLEKNVEKTLRV
jgi:hypothetical protein